MSVEKLLRREEVKVEDTWALEDLYESNEQWEAEFAEVKEIIEKIPSYEGRLAESAEVMLEYFNLDSKLDLLLERLYVYAHQRYDQDTENSEYQAMLDRINTLSVEGECVTAFTIPELLEMDESLVNKFMEEKEDLKVYDRYFKRVFKKKAHILSKEMEELMANSGEITSAPRSIFNMFNNADLKFPTIKDEDGNDIEITHGRYAKLMESEDRRVRKETFLGFHNAYMDFKNTLASIYATNLKSLNFIAKARKYNSGLEMSLNQNEVPVEVYKNLIDAVNEKLPAMHRYVTLRKKLLGVEELHLYDNYAPMVSDVNVKIPFEEAKQTVYDALAPLGEDYRKILKEGFDNRWIDVYENKGKRSGAYSWGAFGTHPYVLLNYQENMNNMFTLAHEMGHALHSYHSDKNQPYVYAGYTIFVAEVASTCNEALLMQHLLSVTKEKKLKANLINYFLEQFKSTLFRQTMFAEFEMITHEMISKGEALTADVLCEIYHNLVAKYFGPDMVIDPEIDIEWARIPHFYTPFYVYQYATGYSAAIAISTRILEEGEPAVKDYIKFLSSGSSDNPIELLKIAGVDMSKKESVVKALDLFEDLIQQMDELMD